MREREGRRDGEREMEGVGSRKGGCVCEREPSTETKRSTFAQSLGPTQFLFIFIGLSSKFASDEFP